MAVLKSSAASTAELASSTSAHHTAAGRSAIKAVMAAVNTAACTRRLASPRRLCVRPCSAQFSRVGNERFLCRLGVHVLEKYAHEHRETDVLVVEEGTQAAGWLALADQPLLPQEQDRRGEHAGLVPAAEVHAVAGEHQRQQHHQLHDTDQEAVHV